MNKAVKKVLGTLFSKTLWLARGTSVVIGLAVMLALVVGVASTALAGTGVGVAFNLGVTNTVGQITKLVGSVGGPSLQIDNNSTNSAATALDLQVESGKAPMKVNSGTKVANLNADKLDGQDSSAFVRTTYTNFLVSTDSQLSATVRCDEGDIALSGGYTGVDNAGTTILSDGPLFEDNPSGWRVAWSNDATADSVTALVLCADLGTPHQQ